jgi:hypothetical protein
VTLQNFSGSPELRCSSRELSGFSDNYTYGAVTALRSFIKGAGTIEVPEMYTVLAFWGSFLDKSARERAPFKSPSSIYVNTLEQGML